MFTMACPVGGYAYTTCCVICTAHMCTSESQSAPPGAMVRPVLGCSPAACCVKCLSYASAPVAPLAAPSTTAVTTIIEPITNKLLHHHRQHQHRRHTTQTPGLQPAPQCVVCHTGSSQPPTVDQRGHAAPNPRSSPHPDLVGSTPLSPPLSSGTEAAGAQSSRAPRIADTLLTPSCAVPCRVPAGSSAQCANERAPPLPHVAYFHRAGHPWPAGSCQLCIPTGA